MRLGANNNSKWQTELKKWKVFNKTGTSDATFWKIRVHILQDSNMMAIFSVREADFRVICRLRSLDESDRQATVTYMTIHSYT